MKRTCLCLALVLAGPLMPAWGVDRAIGPDGLMTSGELLTGSLGGRVSSDSIRMELSMPGIGYERAHGSGGGIVMTGGFLGQTEGVTVAGVRPTILAFEQKGPGEYELTWTGVAGKSYLVQATDSLPALSWSTLVSVTADEDSVATTIPVSGRARFFRIQQVR